MRAVKDDGGRGATDITIWVLCYIGPEHIQKNNLYTFNSLMR